MTVFLKRQLKLLQDLIHDLKLKQSEQQFYQGCGYCIVATNYHGEITDIKYLHQIQNIKDILNQIMPDKYNQFYFAMASNQTVCEPRLFDAQNDSTLLAKITRLHAEEFNI